MDFMGMICIIIINASDGQLPFPPAVATWPAAPNLACYLHYWCSNAQICIRYNSLFKQSICYISNLLDQYPNGLVMHRSQWQWGIGAADSTGSMRITTLISHTFIIHADALFNMWIAILIYIVLWQKRLTAIHHAHYLRWHHYKIKRSYWNIATRNMVTSRGDWSCLCIYRIQYTTKQWFQSSGIGNIIDSWSEAPTKWQTPDQEYCVRSCWILW